MLPTDGERLRIADAERQPGDGEAIFDTEAALDDDTEAEPD